VDVKSNVAIEEDKDVEDAAWTKKSLPGHHLFPARVSRGSIRSAPKPPERVLSEARARCPTDTDLGTVWPYRPIPCISYSHERGAVC